MVLSPFLDLQGRPSTHQHPPHLTTAKAVPASGASPATVIAAPARSMSGFFAAVPGRGSLTLMCTISLPWRKGCIRRAQAGLGVECCKLRVAMHDVDGGGDGGGGDARVPVRNLCRLHTTAVHLPEIFEPV